MKSDFKKTEVTKWKIYLQAFTNKALKIHGVRSFIQMQEQVRPMEQWVPSLIRSQEPADTGRRWATTLIPIQVPVGAREHGAPSVVPSQ